MVALALATLFAIPGLVLASHTGFSDVSTANPFHDDIAWLADTGVTKGCSSTQFCPNDNVTRGQMAAFLHRFSGLGGGAGDPGLVAHEYIVPVAAWTGAEPPVIFGRHLHQHSVLPLYVIHTWIWKDNPSGLFEDYNPKVRMCPDGVPVFGQ
jgi:hypothetical protein